MMTKLVNVVSLGLTVLGALGAVGCGGDGGGSNGLDGVWSSAVSTEGVTENMTLNLATDGSAAVTIVGTDACSGTLNLSGMSWTATSTTIVIIDTTAPVCSGASPA